MTAAIDTNPLTLREAQPPVSLWVCVTCRRSLEPNVAPALVTDGRELFGLIALLHDDHPAAPRISLQPVECMSGCNRACTVALSAAGKVSYLFGDLEPTPEHGAAVLDCALLYDTRPNGAMSRIDRPSPLRKGILARIPPAIFAPAVRLHNGHRLSPPTHRA